MTHNKEWIFIDSGNGSSFSFKFSSNDSKENIRDQFNHNKHLHKFFNATNELWIDHAYIYQIENKNEIPDTDEDDDVDLYSMLEFKQIISEMETSNIQICYFYVVMTV